MKPTSLTYAVFMACLIYLVLPMPFESKLIYLFMGFSVFWMASILTLFVYLYITVGDILISINKIKATMKEVSDEQ